MPRKPGFWSRVLALKRAVRLRDRMRCTRCALTAEEHIARTGKTLEVHRLVPGSDYTLEGCVTLCRACHLREPKSPTVWNSGRRTLTGQRLIPFDGDLLAQLQALADRNALPLKWQMRLIVEAALKTEGLWPPPAPPADA